MEDCFPLACCDYRHKEIKEIIEDVDEGSREKQKTKLIIQIVLVHCLNLSSLYSQFELSGSTQTRIHTDQENIIIYSRTNIAIESCHPRLP